MTIGLYRMRQTVVQVAQFTGHEDCFLPCASLVADDWVYWGPDEFVFRRNGSRLIARPGDWIVKTGNGVLILVPDEYFGAVCEALS